MKFEYSQYYKKPVIHNGVEFWYDPRIVIPATDTMPEQTYAEFYKLTDDDVKEIILKASWQQVRDLRNLELAKSDWTQVEDVPEIIKQPWKTYRQLLRDLPATANSLEDLEWPDKPE